jgi:hypothetical protein
VPNKNVKNRLAQPTPTKLLISGHPHFTAEKIIICNYYGFLHQLSIKGNIILERCHPQCPARINSEAVMINILLNNNVLLNFSLKHNSNLFYGICWNKTSSTVKYSLKICQ